MLSAHGQFFVQSQDFPNSEFNYYTLGGNTVVGLATDGFVFDLLEPPDWESVYIGDELENPINGFRGRIHFLDCQPSVPVPVDTAVTMFHKYIGNNPEKWKVNQHTFTKFKYAEFYKGIDLIAKFGKSGFKYEFVVNPGADPSQIRWVYEGFDVRRTQDRGLELSNPLKILREEPPISFQNERKLEIPTRYVDSNGVYSFELGAYAGQEEIIVDPEIIFTSFGLDSYFASSCSSLDGEVMTFCTVSGWDPNLVSIGSGLFLVQDTNGGVMSIEKFSFNGTELEWVAYIGGSSSTYALDISVGSNGTIAVLGKTRSDDFPMTPNSYNPIIYSVETFIPVVCVLSEDGSQLLASTYAYLSLTDCDNGATKRIEYQPEITYINQDEERLRILNSNGNITIGWSRAAGSNLPSTIYHGDQEALGPNVFIAQFTEDLSSLNWNCVLSSYPDEFGISVDSFSDMAILSNGNLVVCGWSRPGGLPVSEIPLDATASGLEEAWIGILDSENGDLLHGTYFGGAGEEEAWLLHAMENEFVVIGKTNNPENYGSADLAIGDESVWINVYSNDLSELHKHYRLGPETGMDEPYPICLGSDPCGNIIFGLGQKLQAGLDDSPINGMSGWTLSDGAFQNSGLTYFGRIGLESSNLEYGTYFGGIVNWYFPSFTTDPFGRVPFGS